MGASRTSVSVAESTDRTQEMMQAVEGWKWETRLARTALCNSESPCSKGTIIGGQYESISGPRASDNEGRRVSSRVVVLTHDVVEAADKECACPRRVYD